MNKKTKSKILRKYQCGYYTRKQIESVYNLSSKEVDKIVDYKRSFAVRTVRFILQKLGFKSYRYID